MNLRSVRFIKFKNKNKNNSERDKHNYSYCQSALLLQLNRWFTVGARKSEADNNAIPA